MPLNFSLLRKGPGHQNFHNILMEKEISTNIVSQKNDSSGDFNEKIKI